jgi:Protein of unknown function (DUF2892)
MLADTAHRAEDNTPDSINERIRRETESSIARTTALGGNAIEERLQMLDKEWDTERALETLAGSFILSGLALSLTVNRNWLALPGVVAAFLLQHAIQGFCPPLIAIRALGIRTPREIEEERFALKAARGDFARIDAGAASPRALLAAVRR